MLDAMCSHVPNKGEQMVRYYGHYSNVSRGKRKKQDQDGLIPSILEPDGSSKEYRRNWARLIQKIYQVNPLICPKCKGRSKITSLAGMHILAFIEDEEVIKKILKHMGLWDQKARPPPKANARSMAQQYHMEYNASQVPLSDNWLYVDPQYPEVYTPLAGLHRLILKKGYGFKG